MSDDEIKKMQEDAEGHAEEDKKKKESVDIKNEAESFIYTTEKLVNQDLKDKIPQEKGIQITDAIKELKDVLSQDIQQIKPKLEALKTVVNEVTTELYKNASPPPGEQSREQQSDSNEEKSDSNEQKSYANEEKSDSNKQKSDSNSEQKSENNSN
jgi:molecular chaperone DnaK